MNTQHARGLDSGVFSRLRPTLVLAILAVTSLWATTAVAIPIGPGETGTLVPEERGLGISLDIPVAQGVIEVRDLDASSLTLAIITLIFDPSGDGSYEFDVTYRSTGGVLIDVESLFRGLDLVGQLGGPSASEWSSVHTVLNSGKLIWSFSDGSVIVYDPSSSEMIVETMSGSFVAIVPPMSLEFPAVILIQNNTPGTIEAKTYVVRIPTVSEWGLIALATLLVAAGTVLVRRRAAA